jgi:hypothetical protein
MAFEVPIEPALKESYNDRDSFKAPSGPLRWPTRIKNFLRDIWVTFNTHQFDLWEVEKVEQFEQGNLYNCQIWTTLVLVYDAINQIHMHITHDDVILKSSICWIIMFLTLIFVILSYTREKFFIRYGLIILQIHSFVLLFLHTPDMVEHKSGGNEILIMLPRKIKIIIQIYLNMMQINKIVTRF